MAKKLFPALVIISFLVVLIAPSAALAADLGQCTMKKNVGTEGGLRCPGIGAPCLYNDTSFDCGMCCVLNTVYNITDWVFVVLIAAVGIMVILGAFSFLTSAGDPEGVKKGRDYIMYAAIGLIVAFLARAVPALVRMIVGA